MGARARASERTEPNQSENEIEHKQEFATFDSVIDFDCCRKLKRLEPIKIGIDFIDSAADTRNTKATGIIRWHLFNGNRLL